MSNLRDDDQRADSPAATAEAVLEYLAREIVDQPDHVTVEASERRRGVELRLLVDPADLGRVVGKRGRTPGHPGRGEGRRPARRRGRLGRHRRLMAAAPCAPGWRRSSRSDT